jgi:extradiol dioxygenase family protein
MATISQFHLAFPVTDLDRARAFYGQVMGCPEGRSSASYVDFDFYGHQIVAHIVASPRTEGRSVFDGHSVPVPHFGLNLDRESWNALSQRLKDHAVEFIEEPHERLDGKLGGHVTMFLLDPFGNALEFKSFHDHAQAFQGGFQEARPIEGAHAP